MAVLKEIKARIKSVKDTSKVTGAMYGISQMKLHSSSAELAKTEPYFNSLENELTHISAGISADECAFMRQSAEGSAGVLIITSDKGLKLKSILPQTAHLFSRILTLPFTSPMKKLPRGFQIISAIFF